MSAARKGAGRARSNRRKIEFRKKIYDNVHGYIDITEPERQIIDTRLFQRLRRVSHLGLADYVYPGATHSRFSHCIGSMHVMHRIVVPLIEGDVLEDDDLPILRLAALLHDVGHYPFSHVLEGTMRRIDGKERARHERVGEFLIKETSLYKAIRKICDPETIIAIIRREFRDKPLFQYLVSSSLDVDKIDYLQRDSVHTGVAYGAFDVERLLRCLAPDNSTRPTRIVVTRKGRQAVEDFLLGRFHMFQSVYYHKAVVAFELMLDRVVEALVRQGSLPDLEEIERKTRRKEDWFSDYDDAFVWGIMKTCKTKNSVVKELITRLLSRTSLKLADERLTLSSTRTPKIMELLAQERLSEWLSKRSGVRKEWIFYKQQPQITFLEPDSDVTVHIETADGPKPIIEEETSIIKRLWESQFQAYRVYTRDDSSRQKIERCLREV